MARITPAYAGKSICKSSRDASNGDHPRVCGEKGPALPDARTVLGSPPRMRGKGRSKQQTKHQRGITPAYAGKRKVWEGKQNE